MLLKKSLNYQHTIQTELKLCIFDIYIFLSVIPFIIYLYSN